MRIKMDQEFPVTLFPSDILQHKLSKVESTDQKVNIVANNILLRVVYSLKAEGVTDAHKKDVFTSICEIIFT